MNNVEYTSRCSQELHTETKRAKWNGLSLRSEKVRNMESTLVSSDDIVMLCVFTYLCVLDVFSQVVVVVVC